MMSFIPACWRRASQPRGQHLVRRRRARRCRRLAVDAAERWSALTEALRPAASGPGDRGPGGHLLPGGGLLDTASGPAGTTARGASPASWRWAASTRHDFASSRPGSDRRTQSPVVDLVSSGASWSPAWSGHFIMQPATSTEAGTWFARRADAPSPGRTAPSRGDAGTDHPLHFAVVSSDRHAGATTSGLSRTWPRSGTTVRRLGADLRQPPPTCQAPTALPQLGLRPAASETGPTASSPCCFPNTPCRIRPGRASSPASRHRGRLRRRWAGQKSDHNRWLVDFTPEHWPPRRRVPGFANDIDHAVAGWASRAGVLTGGVLPPSVPPNAGLPGSRTDPLWAVCQELDVPIQVHAAAATCPLRRAYITGSHDADRVAVVRPPVRSLAPDLLRWCSSASPTCASCSPSRGMAARGPRDLWTGSTAHDLPDSAGSLLLGEVSRPGQP